MKISKTKKVYKSADTGKIVSKKVADANPKETYAVTLDDLGTVKDGQLITEISNGEITKSVPMPDETEHNSFSIPAPSPPDPPIGVYLRFTNLEDPTKRFIGVIQSLNPSVIIEHSAVNGVHTENEVDLSPPWMISPVTKEEVFAELY